MSADEEVLGALLDASRGHPLCTMSAAKETYLAARADQAQTVVTVHVEAGLAQARQQLWWEEFTTQ